MHVLEYLINLKEKGLSKERLTEEFEKIIKQWDDISVPIKKDYSIRKSKREIKNGLDRNPRAMIIYASGSAVSIAQRSIADLRNNREYPGYIEWCKTREFSGRLHFLAILDKVDSNLESPFFIL